MTPIPPRLDAPIVPRHPAWLYPAIMVACSLVAVAAALAWPAHAKLSYYIPYTFLGNSLAPLPYDGYVIWLSTTRSGWWWCWGSSAR